MADQIDPFDHLRGMVPDDDGDELVRPGPGRPFLGRLRARVEPWTVWFGLRRVVGMAVTVVALVTIGWWLLRAPAPPTEAGLPYVAAPATSTGGPVSASAAAVVPPTTASATVVVHVAGAVTSPGVYELASGVRTEGGMTAAGGATPDADLDALNLAAPLRDGERIYVPRIGEVVPLAVGPPGDTASTGPVDLNRASADELDALPGIGPATAQAIVASRESSGPFASVDDLERVRGIGPAKLEAIRALVIV